MVFSPSIPVTQATGTIEESLVSSSGQGVLARETPTKAVNGVETLPPKAGSTPSTSQPIDSVHGCESIVPKVVHSPILEVPLVSEATNPTEIVMHQPLVPSTQVRANPMDPPRELPTASMQPSDTTLRLST
ncbi:hypothetical protein V6N12_027455 [Hibiscus sabdariffa]|uniref:Uncharacterized protein n=1 Tax=Hibiscus sabdariffa TaxID=183260 RepID=A0ABR2DUW7_9ROSI